MRIAILLIALASVLLAAAEGANERVTLNDDLDMESGKVKARGFGLGCKTAKTCLEVNNLKSKSVTAHTLHTRNLHAKVVHITHLKPANELTQDIVIRGKVRFHGSVAYSSKPSRRGSKSKRRKARNTAFLETLHVVSHPRDHSVAGSVAGSLPQWRLIDHEGQAAQAADRENIKGWEWSDGSSPDHHKIAVAPAPPSASAVALDWALLHPVYLQSPCADAAVATKVFRNLPVHAKLQLTARFHFIGNKWAGHSAFAKVNGEIVWLESHTAPAHVADLRARMSVPVSVTVPHGLESLEVSFGSNLAGQACGALWGVDDINISVV